MAGPSQVTISITTSSAPIPNAQSWPAIQPPKITLNDQPIPPPDGNPYMPCGIQVVVINSTKDITDPANILSNQWQFLGYELPSYSWLDTYPRMWDGVASQMLSSGDPEQQVVLIGSFGLDVLSPPTAAALGQLMLRGGGTQLQQWGLAPWVSESGNAFIQYPANYALIGNTAYGFGEGTEKYDYTGESSPIETTISATVSNP